MLMQGSSLLPQCRPLAVVCNYAIANRTIPPGQSYLVTYCEVMVDRGHWRCASQDGELFSHVLDLNDLTGHTAPLAVNERLRRDGMASDEMQKLRAARSAD